MDWSAALDERLASPDSVLALTGAGVSAESGLATFRGADGLWEGRDPMDLATPEAFEDDPETVWRFYDARRRQAAAAEPNAAHRALAAWQQGHPGAFRLVTQNVDGLHERAGSEDVVRLHGSLWRLRCTGTGEEFEDLRPSLDPLPPRSSHGALLRPAVVWFGEALDPAVMSEAVAAAEQAALVLVVGTSSLVYPAAGLPRVAKEAGAFVVEINLEPTPLTPFVDEHLRGSATEWLPRLAARAEEHSS